MYIIAKGTLDEVLFLLLQKKFRDLGEFVEGKEEQNIVFNKSYRNKNEAIDAICMSVSSSGDNQFEEDVEGDEEVHNLHNLANEDDFQHDIQELAREEQSTLKVDDDDDDNIAGSTSVPKFYEAKKPHNDTNVLSKESSQTNAIFESSQGSSQKDAICLSDDEDDRNTLNQSESMQRVLSRMLTTRNLQIKMPPQAEMINTKIFWMYFNGPAYGFLMRSFSCRLILIKQLGSNTNISTGDIVIGVNETKLSIDTSKYDIIRMKKAIKSPPVKLFIARNEEFASMFIRIEQCTEGGTIDSYDTEKQNVLSN